jgi:hypothetical protein
MLTNDLFDRMAALSSTIRPVTHTAEVAVKKAVTKSAEPPLARAAGSINGWLLPDRCRDAPQS